MMLRIGGIFLVGLLLASGCAHRPPTAAARSASFVPHESLQAEGGPLRDHLFIRSALLIGGTGVEVVRAESSRETIRIRFENETHVGAMATAIDPRGYFLTAGHVAGQSPLHLIHHDGIGFQVFAARVVWKGDPAQRQADLALLHVDRPLLHVFAWGESPGEGGTVIGVGPVAGAGNRQLGAFAGALRRTVTYNHQTPVSTTFFHSAPSTRGDSGGPLVDAEGKLLAVHVGILREFKFHRLSYETSARAHRPDLEWLRRTIEEDFASRSGRAGVAP